MYVFVLDYYCACVAYVRGGVTQYQKCIKGPTGNRERRYIIIIVVVLRIYYIAAAAGN